MVNVIVEDVGPCKKRLKITVPQDQVQAKIEESYSKLRDSAVVDGFRKGHVPRKLLEKRFGEEVLEEIKESLLSESSQKAVEEQGLKPIGEPSFDSVAFEPDQDCVFEITIEIEPEFDLPEYKGLALKRKAIVVSDAETDAAIENLRIRSAKLELMPEGTAVQAKDVIVCDWKSSSDGETVADEGDAQLFVGGKFSGGMELETDLGEALAGAKFGEAREIKGKFSESYPVEKWRGKEGALTMTIKEIRRPQLPPADDAFAKTMDYDSMAELREALQRNLTQSKEREAQMELEEQVFDRLLDATPVELPEGVLKAQARNIMLRQQYRLRQRGIPNDEITKHLEELRSASENTAARNLKIYFILERIADKEKIYVTEPEVESRVATMASQYGVSVQRMRATIEQEGSMSDLRGGMRETKVVDFLLKNANIEEARKA